MNLLMTKDHSLDEEVKREKDDIANTQIFNVEESESVRILFVKILIFHIHKIFIAN